jgi:hypothetical protein
MHHLRSILAALLASTAALPPSSAGAGPGVALTDADKQATARHYVDAGLAAQNAKDFAAAVDFYLRAYDLVPHPLLIYNMGEAHRLAGHPAEALAHYRRYLAADPTGARAADATHQLAPLEREVEAEAARVATEERAKAEAARREREAQEAEERRLAELARRAEEERRLEQRRREDVERALREEAARSAARRRGSRLQLAGLGGGTAGVHSVVHRVWLGERAGDRADKVSA